MEKVSKQQICYKLCSFLPIILVLVLFSFFFFFSSPSLLTTLISLLSAMFLVTLTRKKGSPDRNIVQDNLKKLESQPSLDDDDVTHTEVIKESETGKRHEQQAEAQIDSSFPSDSESFNLSIMDKNLELNAQEYKQHADPDSGSSLPSDSESSTGSIKSEKGIENDHKRNQNLLGISDSLAYDNDLFDDDEEEEEDSLIEIKLPNSHFFGLADDEEPKHKQKLESNLPELLPESIFKHKGLMELLEEINEINEDENLIEIDISIGSTKCQDLRVKQELAYYGDQCVLSD